jgi:hypothetical protein
LSSTDGDRAVKRKFGIVFGLVLAAVALVSLWRGREQLVAPLLTGSALLVLLALVKPLLLTPLYGVMLRIAGYMGWFNTRLILVIVYYLVFTPVAVLYRLMGKDPLSRSFDRDAATYWRKKDPGERDERTHFEKQY